MAGPGQGQEPQRSDQIGRPCGVGVVMSGGGVGELQEVKAWKLET